MGHSTRSLEELIALLREHEVSLVADVRSLPRSRRHPWFNREELERALPAAGINYRHLPDLGGLRRPHADSPNTGWRSPGFRAYADYMAEAGFAQGLAALIDLARRERVAVMCAEALWWRCHRALIADALSVAGLRVAHIMWPGGPGPGRLAPHRLTPFARLEGGRLTYPPERREEPAA